MKKIFMLVIIFLGILTHGYSQEKGYPNPAVAYIQKMGYNFQTLTDAHGNQYTVCIFPDGTRADAWAFMMGKAGQKFSYCAKHGYSTESQTIDNGSFTEQMTVCTRVNANGQKEAIPMVDLMQQNGEPLVDNVERANPEPAETSGSEDPNLRLKDGGSLPGTFDWRASTNYPASGTHSYIGPVRDQGNCGSCYAFGACDNSEGVYNVANQLYDSSCIAFSESFIMWCLGSLPRYNGHFYGCKGADYSYSELEAQITDGIVLASAFPYQTNDPGTCTHWSDQRYSFNNWYQIACSDTQAIKTAIYNYGVIDAAVYAGSAFVNYSKGIYKDNNTRCTSNPCSNTPTNHAIGLVGWGGARNARYFILRNSWGPSWGLSGYMNIDMFSARVACEAGYLTLTNNACTDTYEPNEDFSTAKTISVNTEIKAQIGSATDVDFYTFTSSKKSTYVEVQLYAMPYDYDLYLYDASHNLLGSSTQSGTWPEKIIYNTKNTGTYYVKVVSKSGAYSNQYCYTLLASTGSTIWKDLPVVQDEMGTSATHTLTVYPNPTTGTVNLDYNALNEGTVTVTIYSISGQQILTRDFGCAAGSNTYSLDLGTHSAGMYFLELRDQDGKLFRKISLQ